MPDRPLNCLTILTDQQRYDTLSCSGAPVCRTPHLDRLATEGVRFTHAYTNTAICTAERASVLTGLEPHKHGMLANTERNVGYPEELPAGLVPFTRHLTEAGYRAGLVGKWHLGRERGPEAYGIEGTHLPGWGAPVDHPAYLAYLDAHGLPRWSIRDEHRGVFPNGRDALLMAAIYEGPVEGTYPYFLAERAIAALREYAAGERPFHLSLHFFGPHLPYIVPRAYAEMYDASSVGRSPAMAETFAGKPRVQEAYSRHWAFDTYPWEEWQRITAMYWGYVTLIDEQIGEMLLDRERNFVKDGYTRELGRVLGQGLLTSEGEVWRAHRQLAAHAFTPKRIKSYTEKMVARGAALERRLREALGTKVELYRSRKGGRVVVHFYSEEELQALLDLLAAETP